MRCLHRSSGRFALDALENSSYRDNTIVIFTSDNGYHMGEKTLFSKTHFGKKLDKSR
ncbi:MAG: sulfatase-like hydrolase/transferase [Phycisphaeraceae bacterium]|nr:sulfatase-like hydrolase/transferase [Phycisphaeraceae bacterium]